MLIKAGGEIPSSEITPYETYLNRRRFFGAAAAGLAAAALDPELLVGAELAATSHQLQEQEKLTPFEDVTGYNNFVEFGFGKEDPKRHAQRLRTRPWTI